MTNHQGIKLGSARFPSIRKCVLDDSQLRRHTALYSPDRELRYRHLQDVLAQQARRQGGWLAVISEDDRDQLAGLQSAAVAAGREHDFFVIDLADPSQGHRYNPLFGLLPQQAASRLMGLLEASRGSESWDVMATNLLRVLFDYAFRRGQHLKLATLQIIVERHEAFFPVLMADPVTRRALNALGFSEKGVALNQASASVLVVLANALDAVLYARGFRSFDEPARQVDLRDIVHHDRLCVVVVPAKSANSSAGVTALNLLCYDFLDAVVSRSSRPNRQGSPTFLAVLGDIQHVLEELRVTRPATAKLGGVLMRLASQARGMGVGFVAACAEPGTSPLAAALRANAFTKVWHPGHAITAPIQRELGLYPSFVHRIEALNSDSFVMLDGTSESPLLRIPAAPKADRPFLLPQRDTEFAVHVELNASSTESIVDIPLELQS